MFQCNLTNLFQFQFQLGTFYDKKAQNVAEMFDSPFIISAPLQNTTNGSNLYNM